MVQERRRGWNKLWRCGDLLRNRCCVSHVYTVLCVWERERQDEWESATRFTSPHTSLFPCTHCRQSRAEGARWLARDDAGPWFCHAAVDTRAPTRRLPSLLRSLRARPPLLPSTHILRYTPVAVLLSFFFLIAKQVFVCLLGPRSLAQRERKKGRYIQPPRLLRLHVTSGGVSFLDFLVGWVEGITRQSSAQRQFGCLVMKWFSHIVADVDQYVAEFQHVEASPLGLPKGLYQFSLLHFSWRLSLAW